MDEDKVGFICPQCGSNAIGVTETRPTFRGIRRRRKCSSCGFCFTTIEMIDDPNRGPNSERVKMRDDKIVERIKAGATRGEISKEFGISVARINQIAGKRLKVVYVDRTEAEDGHDN